MNRFLEYLEEQSQFSYATPEQMRDKSGKYLFHVTSKARAKNIVGGGNPEIVTEPIYKGSRTKAPVGVRVQKGEGLKAPGMQKRGGNWGQDVSRLQSVFVTGQKGLGHWQRQVAGSRFSSNFKNYQDEQMGKEAQERSGRVALAVAPETSGEQADVDKIGGIATVKIPIANIPKNVRRRIRIDRSGSRLASKEQELLGAVPYTYGDRKPTADDLNRQKRRERIGELQASLAKRGIKRPGQEQFKDKIDDFNRVIPDTDDVPQMIARGLLGKRSQAYLDSDVGLSAPAFEVKKSRLGAGPPPKERKTRIGIALASRKQKKKK
jgi:hypothetical protein